VRLVLVPGVMSAIDVRGNQMYRDRQIEPFFDDLFGRLVDNQTLQTAMTRMNSLPGLEGFAFLSFGQNPGDAVLNVSAGQESWGQLDTRLNNYGSASTGEYRLASQLTLNNPLKLSEQWRMGGTISDQTENWSVNTSVDFHRLGKHIYTVSGQYQQLALTQDFSLLDMAGWQASGSLGYRTVPVQRLNRTFELDLRLGYLQQDLTNQANVTFFDTSLQDIPLHIGFKGDFAGNKTYLGYEFNADAGYLLSYEASTELSDDYWGLVGSKLSFAQSLTGGALQYGVDLKTQVQLQYGATELPSHRRFTLSGPSKVASYASGAYTADTSVFAETSLTLINVRLGWFQAVLQGAAQAGWGTTNEIETDVLLAAGAVLDLNLGPVNSQVKAFSNEGLEDTNLWFEIALSWPSGG
jgi:hemolysin activation/secretion protein